MRKNIEFLFRYYQNLIKLQNVISFLSLQEERAAMELIDP